MSSKRTLASIRETFPCHLRHCNISDVLCCRASAAPRSCAHWPHFLQDREGPCLNRLWLLHPKEPCPLQNWEWPGSLQVKEPLRYGEQHICREGMRGGYTGTEPRLHHIPAMPYVPSSILQCPGRGRAVSQAVPLSTEWVLCPLGVSCYQGINHMLSPARSRGQTPTQSAEQARLRLPQAGHARSVSWFTSFLHRLSLEPVKAALVVRGSFAMHVSSPNPVSLREQSLCWSLCPCGSQPAWAKPPLKGILRKGCFPCLLPVLQTGDWKLGNDLSASISHIYSMPDNPHRRCGVIHHNRWINECRSWGKCFMFQISSLFQMFTIYNWKAKWKLLLLTDNSHQVLGQPLKSRRHIWPRNGAKH